MKLRHAILEMMMQSLRRPPPNWEIKRVVDVRVTKQTLLHHLAFDISVNAFLLHLQETKTGDGLPQTSGPC